MEIIKLSVGENEELDIGFAEGEFSFNDETFFVYAISTGNLTLLVKTDCSLDEMNQSLQEGFLHVLGLEQILSAKVGKLSGGMKKRVSMGCALAGNPPILLLDEPNAALDLPGKSDIRRYLAFYMEKGGTVIMATHDECDLALCNQVYCLSHGECHKIDNSLRGEALLRAIS